MFGNCLAVTFKNKLKILNHEKISQINEIVAHQNFNEIDLKIFEQLDKETKNKFNIKLRNFFYLFYFFYYFLFSQTRNRK